jgi:hypothetical protein
MDLSGVDILAKKLMIKTAQRWLYINAPEGFSENFSSLSVEIKTTVTADEAVNGVLLFVKNSTELESNLPEITSVLKPETVFWIAYPKKSSGIISDLEMTGNWQETEKFGLQIVASAAIDKTWTALRLRPKNLIKKSPTSNTAIEENELGQFIDTKNRIVYLPEDVKQALEKEPAAFTAYKKLAYTHQKEYIVSILTAKQEKTRTSRVLKMIEKLTA